MNEILENYIVRNKRNWVYTAKLGVIRTIVFIHSLAAIRTETGFYRNNDHIINF